MRVVRCQKVRQQADGVSGMCRRWLARESVRQGGAALHFFGGDRDYSPVSNGVGGVEGLRTGDPRAGRVHAVAMDPVVSQRLFFDPSDFHRTWSRGQMSGHPPGSVGAWRTGWSVCLNYEGASHALQAACMRVQLSAAAPSSRHPFPFRLKACAPPPRPDSRSAATASLAKACCTLNPLRQAGMSGLPAWDWGCVDAASPRSGDHPSHMHACMHARGHSEYMNRS